MTFRGRVTLVAGALVFLTLAAASIVVYVLVRADHIARIDDALTRSRGFRALPAPFSTEGADPSAAVRRIVGDGPVDAEDLEVGHVTLRVVGDSYVQLVQNGEVIRSYGDRELPVTQDIVDLGHAGEGETLFSSQVGDVPVRVYATAIGDGFVLQHGRGLRETQESLNRLAVTLALITGLGAVAAMVVGRIVAATAVRPVHRLSDAAEAVARTGDLGYHIPDEGRDELAKLARSFNTMLDALGEATRRQRQLVADASHELRTPLASLRMNAEILRRDDELDPKEREQLRRDVEVQLIELSKLVENLVELARGDVDEERVDVAFSLDELVADVVEQARRQHPSAELRSRSTRSDVRGSPAGIRRAVANLIDNAVKWSPPTEPIEVEVGPGSVTVTDRGCAPRALFPAPPALGLAATRQRMRTCAHRQTANGLRAKGQEGFGGRVSIPRTSRSSSTASTGRAARAGCRGRGSVWPS